MKKESLFPADNKIHSDINQKHVAHSKIDLVKASGITDGTNKHVYDYVTMCGKKKDHKNRFKF